jgi:NAD(P)-dependent dehydrogenase (short-subunit alcohol dehydrogenase family)
VVTGASRGLGAALASELLERGFRVVGIGRASNPVVAGERYVFVQFDLSGATRSTRRWGRLERSYSPRAPSERISCGLSMVAAKYRRFRGSASVCGPAFCAD